MAVFSAASFASAAEGSQPAVPMNHPWHTWTSPPEMYIVTSNVDSSEAVHDCMSEFWMFIIFVDILCVYTYSSIYCIVQNEDETRNESVVAVAAVPLVLRKQVPEGCQVQPKFHIYICYIYIYIFLYIPPSPHRATGCNRFAFSVGAELESVHMYVHYPCNSYVCDSYLWVQ